MITENEAQKIAFHLQKKSGLTEVAFLPYGNAILYAATPSRQSSHLPSSAIVKLIQGIYENDPSMARKIARSRIFSTAPASVLCRGVVKLAAKRVTPSLSPIEGALAGQRVFEEIGRPSDIFALDGPLLTDQDPLNAWSSSSPPESCEDYLELARRLAGQMIQEGPLYSRDRPVAAILISPENQVLAWSLNTNAKNRTLHAEMNLIQGYWRKFQRPIPIGAKIYVTLKPCKMCAAAIWTAAEDVSRLSVHYLEDDPGSRARNTVLDEDSFERRKPPPFAVDEG